MSGTRLITAFPDGNLVITAVDMLFETTSTRRQRGQVTVMTGTYDLVTTLLFQHLVSQVIKLAEAWPSADAASERLQLVNHTILHLCS